MALGTILSCLITGREASIWVAAKSRNCVIGIAASAPTASCYSKTQQAARIFGCVTLTPMAAKRRCAATAHAASHALQTKLSARRQQFLLKHQPALSPRN